MKTRILFLLGLWVAWLTLASEVVVGVSLQEFGYQRMTVNGTVAAGNRKLAVLLVSYAGATPLAHDAGYYDNFFFNAFATPGVNNYFLEVSDGRFFWARGGTMPLSLPFSQLFTNFNPSVTAPPLRDHLYASNIIHQAMLSGRFDFRAYDDNANGTVEQEELQILIVTNDGDNGGANRNAGCIRPAGVSYSLCAGSVALVNHRTDFASVCHELTHSLGTIDLYSTNCLNQTLSLMSCTLSRADNADIYHIDPWHKLQLGWNEPRIRSLRAGGVESIQAAQISNPATPLLLYDPLIGIQEFFLIEYRAPSRKAGRNNDAQARGDGMVVWHIQQDENRGPLLVDNGATWTVWAEGAPDLLRSQSLVWDAANASRSTTPYLRWNNGTSTRTRLHVRPFAIGAEEIVVEWLGEEELWVDFNYPGNPAFPESGTFFDPFITLAQGIDGVPYGGTLRFKTGSTSEKTLIAKKVNLKAFNGPVLLGR